MFWAFAGADDVHSSAAAQAIAAINPTMRARKLFMSISLA